MRRVLCTRRNKEVAGGSAFTRPCGAWPCGFSALWPQRRVRAVPCLHLSRAGRDARVRFAAAVTRSLLPVCRDFPVVRPLRFRGLTLQLPSAVCVRLRLPLRPCIPALSPSFYGGTAPPGVAEHVTMEDSGMSVVAPAVYVGTWHKYNCGSIAGRWFDLTTFDDERDFFAACRALHQDEADPELMFQDYEDSRGIWPLNAISTGPGLKASAWHGMKAAKRLIVSGWRIPVRRILTPSAMPGGRG